MTKAWKLLTVFLIINLFIYVIGIIVYENFIEKALNPAGGKLAPYGVEILHLR